MLDDQVTELSEQVVLVFYTFPYLGIIFIPLFAFYWIIATYYRRTSVETKRLDSVMRSTLYGSYSGQFLLFYLACDDADSMRILTETLTGLSTVRAYKDQASAPTWRRSFTRR
jgi:uncharacterized protein YybS (DUF2232 family)